MRAPLRTCCLTLFLATAGGGLELTTPAVRLVGEEAIIAWNEPGVATVTTQLRRGELLLTAEQPHPAAGGRLTVGDLPAGVIELAVKLLGGDDAVIAERVFPLTVVDPLGLDLNDLRALSMPLAEKLKRGDEAVILAVGAPGAWSVTPGCADVLAEVMSRVSRGTVRVENLPTGELTAATLATLAPEWLEQHQPDLVLLAGGWAEAGAGVPPSVAARLVRLVCDLLVAAEVPVVVVGPAPRPGHGVAGLVRAMRYDLALDAALDAPVRFMTGSNSLWPDEATGLADLDRELSRLVSSSGVVTQRGQAMLAQVLLHDLTQTAPVYAPVTIRATAELGYNAPSSLSLEIESRSDEELWLNLVGLRPGGLTSEAGLTVTLTPRGRTTVARPVTVPIPGAPVADGAAAVMAGFHEPILACGFTSDRVTFPVYLYPVPRQLGASVPRQRRVTVGTPTVAVRVGNQTGRLVRGQIAGPPGLWQPTFEVGGGGTVTVDAPLPPLGRGRGAVQFAAEAVGGELRCAATALVRYCEAIVAPRGEVTVDGDLSEWADATFYDLDQRDQILDAPDGWDGEADGTTRFAVRADVDGLALALVCSDDSAQPDDAVELLWDPRPGEGLAVPGLGSRLRIGLHEGEPSGSGASTVELARVPEAGVLELWISFAALGVENPVDGRMFGFDLVRIDADADQAPSRMSYTGERWAGLDSGRLGLLHLGRPLYPTPMRLLVGSDDSEPALP